MSPAEAKLKEKLWGVGLKSLKDLEVDSGILASGRDEVYGCIFGRDSLITALKLLRAHERTGSRYFLDLTKKILANLAELQGKETVLESGEEPGKMIHEFRPTGHEHLTQAAEHPWYLYPDNMMRNYDSVDSTPLYLMATHAYWRASKDTAFIKVFLPNIKAALAWLTVHGDSNGDGFIDYNFDERRVYGGLKTQSWMDSVESVFFEYYDEAPRYPIAPVEAQAYAYAAYRAWADFFANDRTNADVTLATELAIRADALKEKFNEAFVLHGRGAVSLAYAIDGRSRPLTSPRSSMGHTLFAAHFGQDGKPDSILSDSFIPQIVSRLLSPDLYVRSAGIRTLSSRSKHFNPNSYHNGSIWPHDTTIVMQGLENFGYTNEAKMVKSSILKAYAHFETPIELFVYANRKFGEYLGPHGGACRVQAWSAAALLTMLGEKEVV